MLIKNEHISVFANIKEIARKITLKVIKIRRKRVFEKILLYDRI